MQNVLKKDKYIALSLLCAIATSNLSAVTVFAQDAQTVLTQGMIVTINSCDRHHQFLPLFLMIK